MKTPADLAGWFLPMAVLGVSLAVIAAPDLGYEVTPLQKWLAYGFASVSVLVLLLSLNHSREDPP